MDNFTAPFGTSPDPIFTDEEMLRITYIFTCMIFPPSLFLGIAGNITNCIVFIRIGLRETVTVSLFILTLSDLSYLLINSTVTIFYALMFSHWNSIIPFQTNYVGLVISYSEHVFYDYSMLATTYIAVTRCCCVAMPLKFKGVFTIKKTLVICTVLFIVNLILKLPLVSTIGLQWVFQSSTNSTVLGIWISSNRPVILKTHDIVNQNGIPYTTTVVTIIALVILLYNLVRASRVRNQMMVRSKMQAGNPKSRETAGNCQLDSQSDVANLVTAEFRGNRSSESESETSEETNAISALSQLHTRNYTLFDRISRCLRMSKNKDSNTSTNGDAEHLKRGESRHFRNEDTLEFNNGDTEQFKNGDANEFKEGNPKKFKNRDIEVLNNGNKEKFENESKDDLKKEDTKQTENFNGNAKESICTYDSRKGNRNTAGTRKGENCVFPKDHGKGSPHQHETDNDSCVDNDNVVETEKKKDSLTDRNCLGSSEVIKDPENRSSKNGSHVNSSSAGSLSRRDVQVIKVVVLVSTVFVVYVMYFASKSMARLIEPELHFGRTYNNLSVFLTYIGYTISHFNAGINSLIYYHFNSRYREVFLKWVSSCCFCKKQ